MNNENINKTNINWVMEKQEKLLYKIYNNRNGGSNEENWR